MTRKDYVIVSTTGTLLFLISIPWFLLVKNHLMLEPPYFRVDPSFVQSEATRQQVPTPDRVAALDTSLDGQKGVVAKQPFSRVQLVNLPTARVGALVHVESQSRQVTPPPEPQQPTPPVETTMPVTSPSQPPSVRTEAMPESDPPVQQPVAMKSAARQTGPDLYGIQVAAFKRRSNAVQLAKTYEETNTEVHLITSERRGKRWYRVILGGYRDKQDAVQFGRAFQTVRGELDMQLVSFQPSAPSGNGESR